MKQVVGFHFTLKDQSGSVLEDAHNRQGDPLFILMGAGAVLPALERHLGKMHVGETKEVIIPPEQSYGEVDPSLRLKLPRSKFPENTSLQEGVVFQGGEEDGWPIIYRIVKIEGKDIYADANHELAGVTLHYDLELIEKRDATIEEISHGHAHGPSGKHGCH